MTARPHKQPDITGLLTDGQLVDLGRIRLGLDKITELIEIVNSLALDMGLPLRPVSEVSAALMGNDISRLVCAHDQAEQRIRKAAFAAVKKLELETV